MHTIRVRHRMPSLLRLERSDHVQFISGLHDVPSWQLPAWPEGAEAVMMLSYHMAFDKQLFQQIHRGTLMQKPAQEHACVCTVIASDCADTRGYTMAYRQNNALMPYSLLQCRYLYGGGLEAQGKPYGHGSNHCTVEQAARFAVSSTLRLFHALCDVGCACLSSDVLVTTTPVAVCSEFVLCNLVLCPSLRA